MTNISRAFAHWEDNLQEGFGTISAESSQLFTDTPYNFKARAESQAKITTPEELLAAAHAACFSMALSDQLDQKGFTVKAVDTRASVTFAITENGPEITNIHLTNESQIPEISESEFLELAELVKLHCPISKALSAVNMTLEAKLV
ncbi:MAG: OsmC family peroxiredoxin [Lactovum sp.]